MVQVPRLRANRRDRARPLVTALALVRVRHAVRDGHLGPVRRRRCQVQTRAGQFQNRVSLIFVPEIGPRLPPRLLPDQQARFDQTEAVAFRIGESFHQHRTNRKIERLIRRPCRWRRRPDEAQLFRMVGKERRGEVVGRDAKGGNLPRQVIEQLILGEQLRRTLRAQRRLVHGQRQPRPEQKEREKRPHRSCGSTTGAGSGSDPA